LDETVRLWDAATGAELRTLRGGRGPVYSVRYSADGSIFVSSNGDVFTQHGDGATIVWDQVHWYPKTILPSNAPVYCVAISSDGGTLATGDLDGFIQFWNTATGEPKSARLSCEERILSLEFAHRGSRLVCGTTSSVARIWNLQNETGQDSRIGFEFNYGFLAIDNDLTTTVALDSWWGIDGWELKSEARLARIRHGGVPIYDQPLSNPYTPLAISPSGELVAAAMPEGKLEVLEVRTGKRIAVLADERGSFYRASFLTDNMLLGLVDCKPDPNPTWSVSVWNLATLQRQYQLPYYESVVSSLVTFPRRNLFAIGGGTAIRIYDLPAGRLFAELRSDFSHASNQIRQLVFSPDGKLLVSVSQDGKARIWDIARSTEIYRLFSKNRASVNCADFSPDGKTLVTGDSAGCVTFWNTESGQEMIRLRPEFPDVRRLQFSLDGERLACWSGAPIGGQQEVRVWSIEPSQSDNETRH
jgi:WD40 repeat protein